MIRKVSTLIAVLAATIGISRGAQAQSTTAVPRDNVSATTFVPAAGAGNYLMVDGASVSGHMAGTAGILLDYADRPFVLYDATCPGGNTSACTLTGTSKTLVNYTATAFLHGSFALSNRFQIGLVVPLTLSNGQPFQFNHDGTPILVAQGGTAFGIGDTRISLKANILGGEHLSVGAVIYGTVPLAQATASDHFLGDKGPMLGGHLISEFVANRFHIAVNLGGFWRESATFLSTSVGPRVTYGVAASYDITPLVAVLGEMTGSASFSANLAENTLEGRLAARMRTGDFVFTLGGGVGLISGLGVPLVRANAGAAWSPDRGDRDNDGIPDRSDACPTDPEDRDGFDDEDGCPEPDNDNDGFPDSQDQCPDAAEDRDGFQDEDGCPDSDNDGDGIQDGYDSCPNVAEDMDGDRDDDGCPDNDRDRDGIDDDHDRCPDQAEDTDGYGDDDGCPETDFDNDGVDDEHDQCPDQAEDRDGVEDDDGCPEAAGPSTTPHTRRH